MYKKLVIATIAVLGLQTNVYAGDKETHWAHWSYEGDSGPAQWGGLSEEYALCSEGTHQSPIEITESISATLPKLELNYQTVPLSIKNNGHSVGIKLDNAGELKFGDQSYQILQVHFHAPSEEVINGQHAELSLHFVHKNKQGQFAVLDVLANKGDSNPLIEELIKVWPKTPDEGQQFETTIDITQLLPEDQNYYTYWGSFTTPPCWEGVRWMILKQPITVSEQQLATIHSAYQGNVRPTQPINARYILSSN